MKQQRHLMKCVLDDTRLNRLRLEGGTVLARIRKEEAYENENYRYGQGHSPPHEEGQCGDDKTNFSQPVSSCHCFLVYLEMLSTC